MCRAFEFGSGALRQRMLSLCYVCVVLIARGAKGSQRVCEDPRAGHMTVNAGQQLLPSMGTLYVA